MYKLILAAAFAAGASGAQAATIDFEGLPVGSSAGTIGNATFSGPSGAIIHDFAGLFAHSGVNTLGGGSPTFFFADILVNFASAVTGLSFWSGGDDFNGVQALIDVYSGGILAATVDLLGDGNSATVDYQDLSAFTDVTAIRIFEVTDPAGLVYDDFTYQTAAVPVPAGGLLLLGAMAGLAGLSRRRREV